MTQLASTVDDLAANRPVANLVVRRATELIPVPPQLGPARTGPEELGLIRNGALAVAAGRILWIGPDDELEQHVCCTPETLTVDARGQIVTPGLIDCHTHLIHGGERAAEFQLRCRGASYQELAAAGGGILSTVRATRAASEEELLAGAWPRLNRMLAHGVTCCEVKSGYGLSPEAELKILRVARTLGRRQPVRLKTTLLAAHAIPPEFQHDRAAYLRCVIEEILPATVEQGLADGCDVFCERGAFTVEEARVVLETARDAGLGLHVHAEQFTSSGGARLAAELGALSADHLEAATLEDTDALARSQVVAVGLPGCNVFLDQATRMNARLLIERGVRVALSTDYNPGTSPCLSLPLIMTLGCARLKLTAAEVLAAVTCEAARALGHTGELGTLQPGAHADLALFAVPSYLHLPYLFGALEASRVFISGRQVHAAI